MPAPKPVPARAPPASGRRGRAPNVHSPSASALTSLSTNAGSPKRSRQQLGQRPAASSGTWCAGSPIRPLGGVDRARHADADAADRVAGRSRRSGHAAISATIVVQARPARRRASGALLDDDLAGRVTTPAAVVVPPTSTPTIADHRASPRHRPGSPSEVAEVAEPDAEGRRGRARGRGAAETDHLDLALAAVAAVGEVGVEPSRDAHMNSDTPVGSARRWASVRARRPVRVRARLAEEVVGRPEPALRARAAGLRVLAAHGHAEAPRGLEHDLATGG